MNDKMIRCFIAVKLPDDILDQIKTYIRSLRDIGPDVRWVKPQGIHITLRFLGEQPRNAVENVRNELHGIPGTVPPFRLKISGTGCFPNARKPRVFWLGIDHDPENSLFKLHEWIETRLEPLGFEREKRRFSPHLTLGRTKRPADHRPLLAYLESNPFPEMSFDITEVIFMRSELRPQGAVYTPIERYAL
jgi:2'-5' RNA ligase